jgi:hypothetical protein
MKVMGKPVTQEDVAGCGIACVAFLAGVKYDEAKVRYFKEKGTNTKGYWCRDIVKALSTAGMNYTYVHVKGRPRFRDGTIVFIARSKQYPLGHYLVKDRRGWMNPWKNFPLLKAESGFERRLLGKPIYAIFKI